MGHLYHLQSAVGCPYWKRGQSSEDNYDRPRPRGDFLVWATTRNSFGDHVWQ